MRQTQIMSERAVRTVQACMLVFMFAAFALGEWIVRSEDSAISRRWIESRYYWVLVFLGLWVIESAIMLRRRMRKRLAKPEMQSPSARVRILQARELIGFAYGLSLALYGLLVRFSFRSSFSLCLPFYVSGLVLFVAFLAGDRGMRREFAG